MTPPQYATRSAKEHVHLNVAISSFAVTKIFLETKAKKQREKAQNLLMQTPPQQPASNPANNNLSKYDELEVQYLDGENFDIPRKYVLQETRGKGSYGVVVFVIIF